MTKIMTQIKRYIWKHGRSTKEDALELTTEFVNRELKLDVFGPLLICQVISMSCTFNLLKARDTYLALEVEPYKL